MWLYGVPGSYQKDDYDASPWNTRCISLFNSLVRSTHHRYSFNFLEISILWWPLLTMWSYGSRHDAIFFIYISLLVMLFFVGPHRVIFQSTTSQRNTFFINLRYSFQSIIRQFRTIKLFILVASLSLLRNIIRLRSPYL